MCGAASVGSWTSKIFYESKVTAGKPDEEQLKLAMGFPLLHHHYDTIKNYFTSDSEAYIHFKIINTKLASGKKILWTKKKSGELSPDYHTV